MKNRFILLSFDVEEFDLPLEYGMSLAMEEQMELGFKGLRAIDPVLQAGQTSTLYTTANFASHYPEAMRPLAEKHEIGSHTFYHSSFRTEDLRLSKEALEKITRKPVIGLRMPRMQQVAANHILAAGFQYDSSLNPTCIPGRYNHLSKPRTAYTEDGLIRLPASVTPHLRLPLFWLMFKNAPYPLFRQWAKQTLRHDGYINLYFHPWEFIDLAGFTAVPKYTRQLCGAPLLERLQKLVADLAMEGEFVSTAECLRQKGLLKP